MYKLFCGLLIAAVLIGAPVIAGAQQESGIPKIQVPAMVLDLGDVAQGIDAAANFEIHNEGSGVLNIRAVRPTCGCTVAEFDREIAPGGKGMIRATLKTKGFNGPISKSILVMTDDPSQPTTTLVIKAMVKPFIEVMPRPLVRFNATQRERATQKVTIVSDTVDSFKITSIETNVPYLKASSRVLEGDQRLKDKGGVQYEVSLTLDEDAPVGPVNVEAVIHTDHPKAPKVPVRVFGVVRALIHVTPAQVQFGGVDASIKPGRNVIVINNRPDREVRVTGVSVNDPAFESNVEAIQEGRRYKISVVVKGDAAAGSRDAVLTIQTDDAQFPELTVPVRASIR